MYFFLSNTSLATYIHVKYNRTALLFMQKNYEFCLYISEKGSNCMLINTFTENVYKGELPCFTYPRNLKQLTA